MTCETMLLVHITNSIYDNNNNNNNNNNNISIL